MHKIYKGKTLQKNSLSAVVESTLGTGKKRICNFDNLFEFSQVVCCVS